MANGLRQSLRGAPMKEAKFEDLFSEGLEDLHDSENQILKALPKMIAAASSEELAQAFQEHLDQTKEHVQRLQTVFDAMGVEPGGKPSSAMAGLLAEGDRLVGELQKSPVLDAALIGAAQRVEHYEIVGYRMLRALAEILGQLDAAELLQETLEEEEETDETLADIAESILTGENTLQE